MNIFVLDQNPKLGAEYHCNKHVISQIKESAQMLSTTCRLSGFDVGYKKTHVNHPATTWARESLSNWLWLKELASHLNDQFKLRYKHTINHKSFDVIMELPLPKIVDKGLTPFAQAMPDSYKNNDAVIAYRSYYLGEKRNIATWDKLNNIPFWWKIT